MTITISVGIIGFSAAEQTRLEQIFAISRPQQRVYKLTDVAQLEPVEVLLVKTTTESVFKQQAYLAKHQGYPIKVVTTCLANAPIMHKQAPCQITGVLIPSKVFVVLDAIKIIAKTEFLHVLVVDDSAMMQKTIHLELQKASMPLTVDFAESGEIALEKVQRLKYDFIFLDVIMPGIDGFETCTRIRQLAGMAKTPIIMLTSKNSALDEVKGLMAGCTTYLTKPFAHDEFQTILERIMYWVKEFNNEK